jgi:hypothetical protein
MIKIYTTNLSPKPTLCHIPICMYVCMYVCKETCGWMMDGCWMQYDLYLLGFWVTSLTLFLNSSVFQSAKI